MKFYLKHWLFLAHSITEQMCHLRISLQSAGTPDVTWPSIWDIKKPKEFYHQKVGFKQDINKIELTGRNYFIVTILFYFVVYCRLFSLYSY